VVLFTLKRATAIIAIGALGLIQALAQAPTKNWKDRAEYDLVQQLTKETNPQTKIGLLKQWAEKYPTSEFKEDRYSTMIQTYQQAGNAPEMLATTKAMIADFPKSVTGLYYLNLLTISMNNTSPDALDAGDKAGQAMLGLMDETFSPAKKPAQMNDDQWKKERSNFEAIAYKTLGWVSLQKQKYEDAEKNFLEVLKRTPGDPQVSAWTGTSVIRQKKLEKQGIALYHIARAAYYDGPGAFPQQARDQLRANFEKNYANFHGDKGGMEQVIELVKANPIPEASFKIESKDEILIKQEEELKKTNPVLALWISIKRELSGPNSAAYFDNTLKNAAIPGGVEVGGTKVERLKGKVISLKPATNPKEVVVGISSAEMSEVTLRFETPLRGKVDPGTELEFSGAPIEFSAEPFNLVFDVEAKDVVGWPVQAAAPPKKAPSKKAPAKK
jgi:tetratricopeptide (TPR) repeat protein